MDSFNNSFIIHVEAGVNKSISPKVARTRMNEIEEVITSILGFKQYNIPVFKVLKSLNHKKKHDIEIRINRLQY